MIHHQVAQNSEAWDRLRLGIPTASAFDRIMTPALGREIICEDCGAVYDRARKSCVCGGKSLTEKRIARKSSQAGAYMDRLLAEWWYGGPLDGADKQTQWMERGQYLEEEAVRSYEFERGVRVEKAGFFTLDDGSAGASPDRLVGADGLLEQKCPSPWVHMGYMRARDVDDAYRVQLQGQLWLTGRTWVDIQSYCPPYPTVIIRVERDEEYIRLLSGAVLDFCALLEAEKVRLEVEYGPRNSAEAPVFVDNLGVSDADVDSILGFSLGRLGE